MSASCIALLDISVEFKVNILLLCQQSKIQQHLVGKSSSSTIQEKG